MTIALISHTECLLHDMGMDHPEQSARIEVINNTLMASDFFSQLKSYVAPLATGEQLARVHDKAYIDFIFQASPQSGLVGLDPDTWMNPHTLNAALRAAGAVVLAVDLVMKKEVRMAFCNVRPPGHHAEHGTAMGFCFFNNIAVGVAYAMAVYGLKRIAIIDFDVHHGNGTEDIFRHDERVMLCSSFQSPFYPYSGENTKSNHIFNLPLSAGTVGKQFREKVEKEWLPALHRFQPEMIFFSAGFDAHKQEALANLAFTEEDYGWITTVINSIADQYAEGRVVSALEGGYQLKVLGACVIAHLKPFLDI